MKAMSHERILVVDDAPTVRQALKLMLEESGYAVDLAAGATEALDGIAAERYDLLLVDKNLDGEDGFAVCRAARERCPGTARILITADQSVESAIQAVEEDIFAYLTKPLRKQQVLLRVRRALDRVRLTREREEARAEMQAAKEALERRTEELEHTLQRLVRAQARLAESEKLVSVGMLAAGVAHEINNPACFILPNLEYIKRSAHTLARLAGDEGPAPDATRAPAAERAQREVEHIDRMIDRCLEGLRRIQKVVGTLQLFSRREASGATLVHLNALCVSLLDLVAHELGDHAQLEVDLRPIPAVPGHEQQLAEAVLNLLLNARRSVFAAPAGRPHRISLRTELREDHVVLQVSDTGPALRHQAGDRALDAFYFGTGDAEAGPGLSLSLVRDIVDRHGGRLELTSDQEGNRFEAFLPVGVPASEGPHAASSR
jgi:two-component system NtrC family sensor kinase